MLTGLTSENLLSDHTSDMELADEFAHFYLGKIEKIRDSIDQHLLYDPPKRDAAQRLSTFRELNQERSMQGDRQATN